MRLSETQSHNQVSESKGQFSSWYARRFYKWTSLIIISTAISILALIKVFNKSSTSLQQTPVHADLSPSTLHTLVLWTTSPLYHTETPLAPYSTVHVVHNHSLHSLLHYQAPSHCTDMLRCLSDFTHTILTSCLFLLDSSTEPGVTEHSSRILYPKTLQLKIWQW